MSLKCPHGKLYTTLQKGDEVFRSDEAHKYQDKYISTPCTNETVNAVLKENNNFGLIERELEICRSDDYQDKPTRLNSFFAFSCKSCAEAPEETVQILRLYLTPADSNNQFRSWIYIDREIFEAFKTLYSKDEYKESIYKLIIDLLPLANGRFWKLKEVIED